MRITKYLSQALVLTILLGTASCGSDTPEGNDNGKAEASSQRFTVVVESVGELFTQVGTRRPISSVSPVQTIDKLALIIVKAGNSPEVIYRTTLTGWSDTENLVSVPWNEGNSQGRKAVLELTGNDCLPDADYMVYAIGYQTGTFGGYEPFKGVKTGDIYRRTEVADVSSEGYADEIFAGAEVFHVHNGKIFSKASSEEEEEEGVVVLRRQVAGTFGFFTRIPVVVQGRKVVHLRLVATRRNKSVIFGGFRDVDDPENFNQENVINGINPRTDYDCRLAGSSRNDAFLVYEIDLGKWFPGNSGESFPFDVNGDGFLDVDDSNWRIDEEHYPDGSINLPQGSVFADCFWIPVAVTEEEVAERKPTFQLQLTDEWGEIIRYWDVLLRDLGDEEGLKTRSVVSLPEGGEGRAVITLEDNPETDYSYSIVRNRLYTMGTKNQGQSYGEDEPIDLSTEDELVLDSKHEWQTGNLIIFQ